MTTKTETPDAPEGLAAVIANVEHWYAERDRALRAFGESIGAEAKAETHKALMAAQLELEMQVGIVLPQLLAAAKRAAIAEQALAENENSDCPDCGRYIKRNVVLVHERDAARAELAAARDELEHTVPASQRDAAMDEVRSLRARLAAAEEALRRIESEDSPPFRDIARAALAAREKGRVGE